MLFLISLYFLLFFPSDSCYLCMLCVVLCPVSVCVSAPPRSQWLHGVMSLQSQTFGALRWHHHCVAVANCRPLWSRSIDNHQLRPQGFLDNNKETHGCPGSAERRSHVNAQTVSLLQAKRHQTINTVCGGMWRVTWRSPGSTTKTKDLFFSLTMLHNLLFPAFKRAQNTSD